jgi:hypothetical protein
MSYDCCRPTHTFESEAYNATQVRLYGIHRVGEDGLDRALDRFKLQRQPESLVSGGLQIKVEKGFALVLTASFTGVEMSAGIIFGYAYEGHCYDLPRPKIMLLPSQPDVIPDGDCGFDEKDNYMVWIVDKLDKCIEIEVNAGFIEQLVLEANLPGRRSPTTYRATQTLAHRGGRLTD